MDEELQHYDLIIIGAGPTGISCAIEAGLNGLKYLLLEKGVLVNSIYRFPTNMTFFSTSKNLEIAGIPFISHTDKPTRKEALEYYRRLNDAFNLNIQFQEKVLDLKKSTAKHYQVTTSKKKYTTTNIVIATGFYDSPNLLGIPGEERSKVKHYYDDAHPYIGMDIAVIGAANSACDVALETWSKGANVTMIVRGETLYQKVKYWILPNIENRIKEGSIKAHFNAKVLTIHENEIEIETKDGIHLLKNDYVLAMTGYRPDTPFLKKIGITIEDNNLGVPSFNKHTFESNLPNVYLAGVIQAGFKTSKLFIENTRTHAKSIISAILN